MHSQSEPSNSCRHQTPDLTGGLDQLFHEARTHSTWLAETVPIELLRKAYELARLGTTSANGSPARFVFLTTPGAKALQRRPPAATIQDARRSLVVALAAYESAREGRTVHLSW